MNKRMNKKMKVTYQMHIAAGILAVLLLSLILGRSPVFAEEYRSGGFPQEETICAEEQLGNLSYATIQDENHRFSETTIARFTEILTISYPKICEEFNDGVILPVTIRAESLSDHPADTSGKVIRADPDYFNSRRDYDALTHELVHVAQQGSYRIDQADLWIIEGTADYGRYKYGLYLEESGFSLPAVPDAGSYYSDSYRVSAAFLKWIEDTKKPGFVKDLNKAIQKQTYSPEYFKNVTGKDPDELWEEYLAAFDLHSPEVDISVPQSVPVPADTDIASYLTIDNKANSLSSAEVAKIRSLFTAVYGKICEKYNYGTLFPVTIVSDPDYKDIAYTDCSLHKVVINPNYYHEHPDDFDSITHELVHIAQNYTGSQPGWIVEGIADYGRNEFGVNNEAAGWILPILAENSSKAISGYKDTAAFFLWIEENYNVKVSEILNAVCKKDAYNPSVWKKITGTGLWSLQTAYYNEFKAPTRAFKSGDSFTDAPYLDENGNRITLSKYVGKPTAVIMGQWVDSSTKEPIERAVFYKKVLGDDIHVLIVCLDQSVSAGKENILKYSDASEKDLSGLVFLSDPGMATTFLKYAKLDEDGMGALFGAPNALMLDEDGNLIYGEYQGDRFLSSSDLENTSPFEIVFYDLFELFPEKREALLKDTPENLGLSMVYRIDDVHNPSEINWLYHEGEQHQILVISTSGRYDKVSYSSSDLKVIKAEADIGNGDCGLLTVKGLGQADVTIRMSWHDMVREYVVHITVSEDNGTTGSEDPAKNGETVLNDSEKNGETDSDDSGKQLNTKGFRIKILNKNEASILCPVSQKKASYVIPESVKANGKVYKVTKIEPNAFKGCKKLKKVTIGKNVTTIGKNAFSNCKKLKTIWINCLKIKKVPKKAFKNIAKKAVFHLASKKK